VIANTDEFTKRNLAKVGYEANPLEDGSLSDYVVQAVAMTTLTLGAVEAIGATKKDGQRAKNMFALGLLSDVRPAGRDQRELHPGEVRPQARCRRGQRAGAEGGLELRRDHRGVRHHLRGAPAAGVPAVPHISGNTAWPTAGRRRATWRHPVVLGSYPITPASDILHELSSTRTSTS
jgi:2-oxoglutarate ferredoxin oxidoreductase subunit alpha